MAKSFDKMFEKIGTWDEFIEDSKKLIGLPVGFSGPNLEGFVEETTIEPRELTDFCPALGYDNPLYTDPRYGRSTRYGGLIAIPTFAAFLKYIMPRGALFFKPYAISTLVAGFKWEYNYVFRPGDTIKTSSMTLSQTEKKGTTGRIAFLYAGGGYWNQYKELVATGVGGNCAIDKEAAGESIKRGEGVRDAMIYERGIYKYSKEEVDKIVALIEGEKRRGAVPLYWEDVNVGDKLTPVVKGPLGTCDLMGWESKSGRGLSYACYELAYKQVSSQKGIVTGGYRSGLNTLTNWPYDISIGGHYDWEGAKSRGMPAPFDVGCFRACATGHLLSDWMGDDGFIRRVDVQFRKPSIYGDTTIFNAEVVKHYKDKVMDEEYGAVDIRIVGMNQLGEVSTPGMATVYLPSKGKPVKLPIPHDDKYEDCEKYYKLCDEVREHRKTDPLWPLTC